MAGEITRLAQIKKNLERRDKIFQLTRRFFHARKFLEVDSLLRVPAVAPEVFITPVQSEGWFLSTSPELYMKRMLAAGYPRLFQIARCFRKGERGRQHNPEFTMLEWYRAPGDYEGMMQDAEGLIRFIAKSLGYPDKIMYQGQQINLSSPWPRVSVREAFLKLAGRDPAVDPDSLRFDTDLCEKVIPGFAIDRPTVIKDYPAPMASLSRLKPDRQTAERAEVFIGGLEIANAYSELTDACEQEKRFTEEIAMAERQYGRKLKMPEHFLEAVAKLPACGGIALGMDRLVMLFCDAASIDEVMAFTGDTA